MESCPHGTLGIALVQNETIPFLCVNLLTMTATLSISSLYALSRTLAASHSLAKLRISKHLYALLHALHSYYKPNYT